MKNGEGHDFMSKPLEGSGSKGTRRGMLMQVITALACSMSHFNIATAAGYGGVFIEQLTSPDADLTLTRGQVNWIISVHGIGTTVGFVLSSYVNSRLGTVRLMLLSSPLSAAGWLMMAFGNSF